jgi:hypothetical protein
VTAGDLNLLDVLKANTVVAVVGALDILEKTYSSAAKPAAGKRN